MEAFGVWAVDCALPVRKESLPSTGRFFETGWFARCAMLIAAFQSESRTVPSEQM